MKGSCIKSLFKRECAVTIVDTLIFIYACTSTLPFFLGGGGRGGGQNLEFQYSFFCFCFVFLENEYSLGYGNIVTFYRSLYFGHF